MVGMRTILLLLCVLTVAPVFGEADPERVEFKFDGKQRMALGNILVEAEDGGILLESRNQTIWPLQPDEIVSRKQLEDSPEPLTKDQLATAVRNELGSGLRRGRRLADYCGAQ